MQLVVDTALEDIAGNAVAHVFDRDLDDPAQAPLEARRLAYPFTPGPGGAGRRSLVST
jgi:hypothetical protein